MTRRDTPRPRGWWQALAAAAAGLVLFVVGAASGWYGRELLAPAASRSESLVADAAAAHLIYAAEKRHAVEVPASEEEHLATWLGRRLAVPLRIPHLGDSGYELVGGRLLPAGSGQPAAQLMYQDDGGRRVTLYVRATPGGEPAAFQLRPRGRPVGAVLARGRRRLGARRRPAARRFARAGQSRRRRVPGMSRQRRLRPRSRAPRRRGGVARLRSPGSRRSASPRRRRRRSRRRAPLCESARAARTAAPRSAGSCPSACPPPGARAARARGARLPPD